ncbi:MAG: hypothetical protein ACKOKG_05765 [Verrucomicrobiota bacterium]
MFRSALWFVHIRPPMPTVNNIATTQDHFRRNGGELSEGPPEGRRALRVPRIMPSVMPGGVEVTA